MNEETRLMEELEQFEPVPLHVRYPAALAPRIAPEDPSKPAPWRVVMPDLPGCKAIGDTQEEAMTNAIEAVEAWIGGARGGGIGSEAPPPSSMDTLAALPEWAGWTWFFVGTARLTEVDQAKVAETFAEEPAPADAVATVPTEMPDGMVDGIPDGKAG